MKLEIRIERGPHSDADPAWHWAVYVEDDFIGFSNHWYASPEKAAEVADSLFRPSIPIYLPDWSSFPRGV